MKPLGTTLAVSALFLVPTAGAKEFQPGDLRVCGAVHCRVLTDAATTRAFGALLYGPGAVASAPTPGLGAPVFRLRFRDGSAGVILSATVFRVHGLNCGRFRRGRWYRLPVPLRGLTAGLKPRLLRPAVPHSC
jgi:hypothetical protein